MKSHIFFLIKDVWSCFEKCKVLYDGGANYGGVDDFNYLLSCSTKALYNWIPLKTISLCTRYNTYFFQTHTHKHTHHITSVDKIQ